jgi:hypothetical protein
VLAPKPVLAPSGTATGVNVGGDDPAIAATAPALPRATVKLQSSPAPGKPVPSPVPMPKATIPLASAPSATVALPKGAVPVSASVAGPVIKKVPNAPKPTETTAEETEVDVSDDVPAVSGMDKMLAGIAVVVALLSTLTSLWAYTALK